MSVANGEQEEHRVCHGRGRGRAGDAPEGPSAAEQKPTVGRLHGMFEEALDGLLREERAAAPAAADGRREAENGDRDGLPVRAGVGWVEVARRVSEIAVRFFA